MSWDQTWESIYQTRGCNRYPSEEVIGFIMRHFSKVPDRKQIKILEIGCGQGANLSFLAREGFDTYGIDGSKTAIEKSEEMLSAAGLSVHLQVGDFIDLGKIYTSPLFKFDAILDKNSLQHNPMDAMQRILDQVWSLLKPQGKVFSIMVQAGTYGDGSGTPAGLRAYRDIEVGHLKGWGFFTILYVRGCSTDIWSFCERGD
jgi:2-polyprenyl-3-methyl-5-hydroxy-6-metoxy-1,4-benzoquinol methylase